MADTLTIEASTHAGRPRTDHLYVVLEGARPRAGGMRCDLAGVTTVHIGRGPERHCDRGDGVLRLALPDPRLSSEHATLVLGLSGWELRDLGSKNGSRVDGELASAATLGDRSVLELGRTLLQLRRDEPAVGADAVVELHHSDGLVSLAPALSGELERVRIAAASTISILLRGETGTGKEVLTRALHQRSGRAGRLVAVNCGALSPALIESELFGHRRGAFSGADRDHEGYIRAASGGTLLLDEIGDLPLPAQAALLRVLNDRQVVPVGETHPIAVDFRLVSATHRDLADMVRRGAFREDLLARITGLEFELPPLRERLVDLGLLVSTLLPAEGAPRLSPDAARALVRYAWPRNIRELEAALAAAVVLAGDAPIELAHLPPAVAAARDEAAPGADEHRRELLELLREHGGNVSAIARATGKARMQIQRWLKRYGLDPEQFRR